MNTRLLALINSLKDQSIDYALITDPKNMYYYSGFYNGEGYLLIGESGNFLVTDSRYTQYALSACPDFEVCDIAGKKLSDFVPEGKTLGFEDKKISYSQYLSVSKAVKNLVPLGSLADSPREVKDPSELSSIKKSVAIADRAFTHICSYIRKGMTEKEVAAEIDCYMKKNGAEGNSFPTIVASGERGSLPHAIPTDRKLSDGDLVVMDYGCVVDGYCSDMTRTVAVGDITEECEKIYQTVLTAQLKALGSIRAGAIASSVDKIARDIIYKDYKGYFGHSLGHSVGLDIHESPNLSPKNTKPVECGNVLTVEPGIYIPSLCGVRIEDMVVANKDGCLILTQSPKNLIKVG